MREVGASVPVARQPLFLDAQKELLRLICEVAQKFVFQGTVAARLPRQMARSITAVWGPGRTARNPG